MEQTKHTQENTENPARSFLVWDLPTRLFHWLLVILLFTLLVQAATGLFANDDILTEGPLFDWVGKATSDWLTTVHKLNQQVIIALVCVHVAAVLVYFFYKCQNLILPMITGVKLWHGAEAEPASGRTWLAVLIAGLAGLAVYLLIR